MWVFVRARTTPSRTGRIKSISFCHSERSEESLLGLNPEKRDSSARSAPRNAKMFGFPQAVSPALPISQPFQKKRAQGS
jgi:hypothetical protein